ncbi:MAG: DUF882 domain-containing protein [Devosia sp.]|nr:DUF882 domain-containing protein [Devosia sp.]
MRLILAAIMALTVLLPPTTIQVSAASGDRTLYLYHTHTKQIGRFTFRRNGQYDQRVLRDINIFLADWRTKEPTKMDPALFDLLWSVYQEVGATQPVSVVSSYRSPKTNAMLARRSSGVAENSQHMKGKAMDFFIPGVDLTRLREVAMRHQVGGVGYYPTSGSPFVHLDTGSVRAWPRMTRAQLKKVFPDGRTLHLPTDGTPLSNEGRRYAEAQWQKCRAVPCNGGVVAPTIMLASLSEGAPLPAVKPRTLMSAFSGDGQQAEIQLASLQEPTQRTVSTIGITAPAPAIRSSADILAAGSGDSGGPVPAQKSPRLMLATRSALPGETALSAVAALGSPVPRPRLLMTPESEPELVTAYVPASEPDPGAQLALRMIIERETTASVPARAVISKPEPVLDASALHTASLGGGLQGMFEMTFNALTAAKAPAPMAAALTDLAQSRQPNRSIEPRPVELVAPEVDHVNETLVHPVLMSSAHFAVLTEAEGYLDKATELGPLSGRMSFRRESGLPIEYDRFVSNAPLLVAAHQAFSLQ